MKKEEEPPEEQPSVVKPVFRLDEVDVPPESVTVEGLIERFGMMVAPPGANPPTAICSSDFRKNGSRCLVLVPSADAPWPGVWDGQFTGARAAVAPIVAWGLANGYAIAVFSPQALLRDSSKAWDSILCGSPARVLSVVVAGGALPTLTGALMPLHSLLYSRLRTICVAWGEVTPPIADNDALKLHLKGALAQLPAAWGEADAFVMHQCLFQLLADREDSWQKREVRKYVGFKGMTENDLPGVKRLTLDKRVERLDRDRKDDELARLLKANEGEARGGDDDEDEPGVD